jgi:DNA replication and repair protein RecF
VLPIEQSIREKGSGEPFGTVEAIELLHFRNYPTARVDLSPGFNVIVGPNAQGKTNFLEALYLLSTTRLLRGQKDSEAVLEGADLAKATATLSPSETLIGVEIPRSGRKKATLNGLALPRASDLIGRLPCTCISTVDMEIVRGDPAERRLFLDLELSAASRGYFHRLALYKRALEQRNALLRDSRDRFHPPETFEVWEDQLAQSGAELRIARVEFIDQLSPFAAEVHQAMGSGETIRLAYVQKDPADSYESLLTAFAESRSTDVARGGTSVGPHRDDLEVLVGDRSARLFGSQGQQRTAVVALKLATLKATTLRNHLPPLLLLDDILSDLDEGRRERLIELVLSEAGQAVLTCTEVSVAGEAILQRAKIFRVQAGTIQEA